MAEEETDYATHMRPFCNTELDCNFRSSEMLVRGPEDDLALIPCPFLNQKLCRYKSQESRKVYKTVRASIHGY